MPVGFGRTLRRTIINAGSEVLSGSGNYTFPFGVENVVVTGQGGKGSDGTAGTPGNNGGAGNPGNNGAAGNGGTRGNAGNPGATGNSGNPGSSGNGGS
jgi:hypothetical protein